MGKQYSSLSKEVKTRKVVGYKYYVEMGFGAEDQINSDQPYLIQSKDFDSIEEAENFVDSFDYIDDMLITDIITHPSGFKDYDQNLVERKLDKEWIKIWDPTEEINNYLKKEKKTND